MNMQAASVAANDGENKLLACRVSPDNDFKFDVNYLTLLMHRAIRKQFEFSKLPEFLMGILRTD